MASSANEDTEGSEAFRISTSVKADIDIDGTIEYILEKYGLEKFINKFQELGVSKVTDINSLNEEMVKDFEIDTIGNKKRFKNMLKDVSETSQKIEEVNKEKYPIHSFLKSLELDKFTEKFIENEYKDLADLIDMSNDELARLGIISIGNRKKLEKGIREILPTYFGESKIPKDVFEWCSDWFVSELYAKLINNDINSLEIMAELEPNELLELGINNKVVTKRVLRGIEHLKNIFNTPTPEENKIQNNPINIKEPIPANLPEINASKNIPKIEKNHGKELMVCNSNPIKSKDIGLTIYQPIMQTVVQRNKYCKLSIGPVNEKNLVLGEKVIMLFGEMGAGKTTLINSFVNYLFGVEYEDSFRFKLVVDTQGSQFNSSNSLITAYQIRYQVGFTFPFNLTIIDTPRFCDSRGIKLDVELAEQITDFFTTKGDQGIDHIDAVGFVCQSSLTNLTTTQTYIFNQILTLFGKDISTNIFLLLTFADDKTPQILQGIKEAEIPFNESFKFNSSVLYSPPKIRSKNDDDLDDDFGFMFWRMFIISSKKFFDCLISVQPRSLLLTQNILERRERIETKIMGLHQQIQLGLNTLEQYRNENQIVHHHEEEIEMNENFQYTINKENIVQVTIKSGRYTTNCLVCNITCHYPCKIPNNDNKKKCIAMDRNGDDSKCIVCPQYCHWSKHHNAAYSLETERQIVTRTSQELLNRYRVTPEKKLTVETLTNYILNDFEEEQLNVFTLCNEVSQDLKEISRITFQSSPLSTREYIEIMIQSEQRESKPGWSERIKELESISKKVRYMEEIKQQTNDPFGTYKEEYDPIEEYRKRFKNEKESRVKEFFKIIGNSLSVVPSIPENRSRSDTSSKDFDVSLSMEDDNFQTGTVPKTKKYRKKRQSQAVVD